MISDENQPFVSFSINGNRPTIISELANSDKFRYNWYDGEAESISLSFSDGRYFEEQVVFTIIPKGYYDVATTTMSPTPSPFNYTTFDRYFENWSTAQIYDDLEIVFDFINRVWYLDEHEMGKINVDFIDTFIISERGL